ncbi:MAG: hypothetical protein ACM32O_01985 [Clostridia bacterium]
MEIDVWDEVKAAILAERQFSLNQYNGQLQTDHPVDIIRGANSVLLSVPHATNHWRNNKLKYADRYTGALGLLLQRKTNCSLIYTNRFHHADPNYDLDGIYKHALAGLLADLPIRCVIDLHGAGSKRPFDIDLGTRLGTSINASAVEKIKRLFIEHGITEVKENHTFTAMNPGTITTFCSNHCNTEAIQIEINGKYRSPLQSPSEFRRLVRSLVDMIAYLEVGESTDGFL